MSSTTSSSRGIGELLRDLVHGSADLLRGELRLARMEVTSVAAATGRGTASVALGAVLLLLGGLAFFVGVVMLIGDQWLPRDRYWLAGLVAVLVAGTLAAIFAKRGLAALSPRELAPDQTLETLKEDKEWLKQQLTSGATSS